MKAPRKKIILAVCLWCFVLVIIGFRSPLMPWLSLKSLEWQVKRNIDPVELQQWATNRIAEDLSGAGYRVDHDGNPFVGYHGTNFPTGLQNLKIYREGMGVIIRGGLVPHVQIFCQPRQKASHYPFLIVGRSALSSPTNGTVIAWKPGIYFVGDELDWR